MTATATAFYNLYKTLPREVKEEVKTLIKQEITGSGWTEGRWEEAERLFDSLRKGLPADYRFNREEANER